MVNLASCLLKSSSHQKLCDTASNPKLDVGLQMSPAMCEGLGIYYQLCGKVLPAQLSVR